MHSAAIETVVLELSYAQAVNAALQRCLKEMPDTVLYGEDVAAPGGIFGVTKNLQTEFGDRVFDTPISETAMLGTAVGAAMTGLRPIVEIMWADFTLVAMDQIVNQAANVRYVSAGKLGAPLTIRTQQGFLPGSCAQHSQNLEALYAHVPGLRVGLAATPQDAYSMTMSAVACNDPTLVIENRGLYHGVKQAVAVGGSIAPVGGAVVERTGTDITILSWSAMLLHALTAADQLQAQGTSAEVINARWLNPFDWGTLFASVRKTGRLLVVHEAVLTGGFGAEVAAQVGSEFFGQLRAPVERLATTDSRIPSAPHLQRALIPDADRIAQRAKALAAFK
ncbi:MAG: acetoin dehydrogenase [Variovorax sp.]|nr:MAG: acetoin dehydrogenase [Variovorax sp.]